MNIELNKMKEVFLDNLPDGIKEARIYTEGTFVSTDKGYEIVLDNERKFSDFIWLTDCIKVTDKDEVKYIAEINEENGKFDISSLYELNKDDSYYKEISLFDHLNDLAIKKITNLLEVPDISAALQERCSYKENKIIDTRYFWNKFTPTNHSITPDNSLVKYLNNLLGEKNLKYLDGENKYSSINERFMSEQEFCDRYLFRNIGDFLNKNSDNKKEMAYLLMKHCFKPEVEAKIVNNLSKIKLYHAEDLRMDENTFTLLRNTSVEKQLLILAMHDNYYKEKGYLREQKEFSIAIKENSLERLLKWTKNDDNHICIVKTNVENNKVTVGYKVCDDYINILEKDNRNTIVAQVTKSFKLDEKILKPGDEIRLEPFNNAYVISNVEKGKYFSKMYGHTKEFFNTVDRLANDMMIKRSIPEEEQHDVRDYILALSESYVEFSKGNLENFYQKCNEYKITESPLKEFLRDLEQEDKKVIIDDLKNQMSDHMQKVYKDLLQEGGKYKEQYFNLLLTPDVMQMDVNKIFDKIKDENKKEIASYFTKENNSAKSIILRLSSENRNELNKIIKIHKQDKER